MAFRVLRSCNVETDGHRDHCQHNGRQGASLFGRRGTASLRIGNKRPCFEERRAVTAPMRLAAALVRVAAAPASGIAAPVRVRLAAAPVSVAAARVRLATAQVRVAAAPVSGAVGECSGGGRPGRATEVRASRLKPGLHPTPWGR